MEQVLKNKQYPGDYLVISVKRKTIKFYPVVDNCGVTFTITIKDMIEIIGNNKQGEKH